MSNQLQNKLLHYEVSPPDDMWGNIATSLDENDSFSLSQKLYQYEEEPPAAIWQNIVAELENRVAEQAKVVPFYVRYRRPLKYSGAVAAFIFLAVLTSLLISKKTESEVPTNSIANSKTSTKTDTSKNNSTNTETNTSNIVQNIEKVNSQPAIAKSKVSRIRQEESVQSYSIAEDLLPRQAMRNEIVNPSIPADKYMMYSDGDGNVVRLPKKIFSAFACPLDDTRCKQRLQQLREKFAASAMTADFTGLLQILKSLQENQ